ncbi:MAG: non-homologous end-joining DNA ligase LigD, partial [Frankiaceae bacterium]
MFAPLVAARPVMRVSGDGGSSYPLARRLSVERPVVPAAVATFDAEGRASNVVFDLDVSKGGPERVAADAERLAALLAGVGAAYVVDESPSGGLHVHVPLAEPAEFAEVARVMRAAKALFVS